MDLNFSFLTGLGCGICIGISLFALKKYFGSVTETAKAVKKVNCLYLKDLEINLLRLRHNINSFDNLHCHIFFLLCTS